MKNQLLIAIFGAIASAALLPNNAHALTITKESGSECPGGPGGFSACTLLDEENGSPTIIKFNQDLNFSEKNTAFFSVNGSEFTFSNLVLKGSEIIGGDWFYNPGADDPGITAWAAKAGNGYNLFNNNGIAVTSGKFFTPDDKGLSHLTFFDTATPPTPVPTPAAVLPGLLSMATAAFRNKKQENKELKEV